MFNYVNARIARSEATVNVVPVPPWEVAVLVAVHGGDIVSVEGPVPVRREIPSAQAEYDRLATKYGKDNDSGIEFVAAVYGAGARGVAALAAEIAKLTPPPAAVQPVVQAKPAEVEAEDDPLADLGLEDSPEAINE